MWNRNTPPQQSIQSSSLIAFSKCAFVWVRLSRCNVPLNAGGGWWRRASRDQRWTCNVIGLQSFRICLACKDLRASKGNFHHLFPLGKMWGVRLLGCWEAHAALCIAKLSNNLLVPLTCNKYTIITVIQVKWIHIKIASALPRSLIQTH